MASRSYRAGLEVALSTSAAVLRMAVVDSAESAREAVPCVKKTYATSLADGLTEGGGGPSQRPTEPLLRHDGQKRSLDTPTAWHSDVLRFRPFMREVAQRP